VDVPVPLGGRGYGPGVLAVVLTGMGQDGRRGCESVRAAGGQVLAQDEASSVVWGMPRAVALAGLTDRVLPLDQLGPEIVRSAAAGPDGAVRPRGGAGKRVREPRVVWL